MLDYGTSATNTPVRLTPKARRKKNTTTKWDSRGWVFQTQAKAAVLFQLPELDHTKTITYVVHVYDTKKSHLYDMIMGQELMQELGLDIKFSDYTVRGKSPGHI